MPLLRIHIAADGSSTGDVLDQTAGASVLGTYKLVWPQGYATKATGGALTLSGPDGGVIAHDGDVLANVGTCGKTNDTIDIGDPGVLASPAS